MRTKTRKGIKLVYLDKPATTKKGKHMATSLLCKFDSHIETTARPRPCAKCAKRKRPFSFPSHEIGSPFRFWTAELKNGAAITFRTARGQKPEGRIEAITLEYSNHWDSLLYAKERRWDGRPSRGRMWAAATVNAAYPFVATTEDVKAYRPATPCEIMGWFTTHEEDLYTFENPEAILAKLETYL